MRCSLSVIILTFNSDLDKLCSTLNSILFQKNINLEVIVTDDGSDNYDEINRCVADLCEKRFFFNYKILPAKKNQGTVRNALNGVLASSNEYVKLIAPGDLLFSNDTLESWGNFAVENQCDISGGYAVWYSIENDKINLLKKPQMPQNAEIYSLDADSKDKVEYVIYAGDVFHGVGMIVRKTVLKDYLNMMIDRGIVFSEDLFFRLAVLDCRRIVLYQHNVVWYEYGYGISTSKDSMFSRLIKLDVRRLHILMEEIIIKNRKEYSSYINDLYWSDGKQTKWYKAISLLFHPRFLKYKLKNRMNMKYTDIKVNIDFLKLCICGR